MPRRLSIIAAGITISVALAACGGSSSASSKVATLDNNASGSAASTTVAVNTQEALLAYASCMRDNGIDMADPTFDANGNPTGGGFGGGGGGGTGTNSGIDRQSDTFKTAQKACQSHLQGVTFGGRLGGQFDRAALQDGLNKFTACLRDNGVTVDDITLGNRPAGSGNGGGNGPPTSGQLGGQGDGAPSDVSVPRGGFGGPPGAGQGRDGNGPGGAGFDPTARMIERLNLDEADPTVAKAMTACKTILTDAFTPTTTTQAG
ncbi:unannotated protein [freshwater metagenome]|uniref:Unannotated protein n=1 Tax=freshwater metagenome TaxID=449393 RepID=A0A6J7FWV7_9ZZZZ